MYFLAFKCVLCLTIPRPLFTLFLMSQIPSLLCKFYLSFKTQLEYLFFCAMIADYRSSSLPFPVLISYNPCHPRDIAYQVSNKGRWRVYWNMRECFLLNIKENLVREGYCLSKRMQKDDHREECRTCRCFYGHMLRQTVGAIVWDCYLFLLYMPSKILIFRDVLLIHKV